MKIGILVLSIHLHTAGLTLKPMGGIYAPLWFFGSGFKRIWSTDLKFCDFSYMVIGWVPTKFQADLMMF